MILKTRPRISDSSIKVLYCLDKFNDDDDDKGISRIATNIL